MCAIHGAFTTDHDQCVYSGFVHFTDRIALTGWFLKPFAAAGQQHGTTALQNTANITRSQRLKLAIDKALVSVHYTDYVHVIRKRSSYHGADRRIHAGGIATGSKYPYCKFICHVRFLS